MEGKQSRGIAEEKQKAGPLCCFLSGTGMRTILSLEEERRQGRRRDVGMHELAKS